MSKCPTFEQLSLAASRRASPGVAAHVDDCPACRGVLEDLERLRALAKQAPAATPDRHDLPAREEALVAAARARRTTRDRRTGWVGGFALGAAAAASLLLASRLAVLPSGADAEAPPVPLPAGPEVKVTAGREARYERRSRRAAAAVQDETILLEAGELEIEVPPRPDGHAVKLEVSSTVVELARAHVRASAVDARLERLEVLSGQARVRGTEPEGPVEPGETWRPSPSQPSLQEQAFARGFEALDTDPHAAGDAFEAAIAAAPEGELAEDARFWLATARARTSDRAAAEHAIEAYLARHRGARAGRLALLLAAWRLDAGQPADGLLRRAREEGDEDTRARARTLTTPP